MKRVRSRKGAPGIVEVAARANVSIATVSRAFNEPNMVREPTRNKIRKAADELGYIRDRIAGALHNKFSGTIGLVVPTIDNAIFAELIEAFSSCLLDHDRTMLIAAHGYDLQQEVAIVRSLLERRIDGIALVGFDHNSVSLNMLLQRDVPVISIWNYAEESLIPCVGADNFEAGKLVTQHLIDLGHKNINYIFADTKNNDRARNRLDGALSAARASNLNPTADRIFTSPYDIGEAKKITIEILTKQPSSAIVCGNDIIAHGALYACQSLGIEIPNDISIVGIGDFRSSAHMEPSLSTIRMPAKKIGRLAAEILVEMNETGMPPSPFHQKMELTLMHRSSTGAVKTK